MANYTALIVAAGAGTRMGLGYNKAYYRMQDDRTILEHTMDLFLQDPDCEEIVVVTDSEDYYHYTGPDTIKIVEDGRIKETLPRSTLMAAQTPQAFRTKLLFDCMEKAKADGFEATDDCSVVEAYSDVKIQVVEGSYANKKITTAEDL